VLGVPYTKYRVALFIVANFIEGVALERGMQLLFNRVTYVLNICIYISQLHNHIYKITQSLIHFISLTNTIYKLA